MSKIFIAFLMVSLLSSCLKQSISDAILDDQNKARGVATMTYEVNGNTVTTSVDDPGSQNPVSYQLGCTRLISEVTNNYNYQLNCLSASGYLTFTFFTDSLTTGNYLYTGLPYVGLLVANYNGTDDYIHVPTDSVNFNVTSYSKGRISGNFSGRLTPQVGSDYPYDNYGDAGSVLITKGTFKDVPVFY